MAGKLSFLSPDLSFVTGNPLYHHLSLVCFILHDCGFPFSITSLFIMTWSLFLCLLSHHVILGNFFMTLSVQFSSVQSLSCIRLFPTPWTAARQASLSITNSWSSLKLLSIESVMPSNHLILYHPLKIPFMRGILFLYLIIYDGNTFLWPWLLLVTGYSLFVSISFR